MEKKNISKGISLCTQRNHFTNIWKVYKLMKGHFQLGTNVFDHTANAKDQHLLIVKFNSSSCSNPTPYGKDNSKCKIVGLMTAEGK